MYVIFAWIQFNSNAVLSAFIQDLDIVWYTRISGTRDYTEQRS